MRADELASPSGEAVKFDQIGTTAAGTIVFIGDWVTRDNTKIGKTVTSFKLVLEDANGKKIAVYPEKGSQMARAIGEAITAAGAVELQAGGRLGVRYDRNEDVGKASPMHVFVAQYQPPVNSTATRTASDLL